MKLSISCLPNFLQVSQESQVLSRPSQPPLSVLYTLRQISEFCWNFPIFFLICSFHKNHRFSWGLPYLPIYCFSLFKFFVIFATACVAVNFLFQLIFVFALFLGMVMYANEFETKEKQKLTEIKNKLQHMQTWTYLCILVVYTPMKQKPKK